MIRTAIENYIIKTRNSNFRFDKSIPTSVIMTLLVNKFLSFVRGLRFLVINKRINKIFLGRSVKVFIKNNIYIGTNVTIGDSVSLSALGKGKLSISDNVNIGAFSQLIISTSFNNIGEYIKIEKNVALGEFSYLGGAGGLEIGSDTIIGQYFSAHPENHNYEDNNLLIREQGTNRKGIKIGSNCWIGAKVTILDGVVLGNHCVIAAGAVVTHSFTDNAMIGGIPAKIIRDLK